MDGKLIFAIITITLALVFYTTGVFGERKAKTLNKNHVIIFWLGLIFDTIGTFKMGQIAKSGIEVMNPTSQSIHGITRCLSNNINVISCRMGNMGFI